MVTERRLRQEARAASWHVTRQPVPVTPMRRRRQRGVWVLSGRLLSVVGLLLLLLGKPASVLRGLMGVNRRGWTRGLERRRSVVAAIRR
jgi:hypothetical protein